MDSLNRHKKKRKFLPSLNILLEKKQKDESKNIVKSNNNNNDNDNVYKDKKAFKFLNPKLSEISIMTNPIFFKKKNTNNKITSIPITNLIKKNCINNNYKKNVNNFNTNNCNNNRQNIILNILRKVNNLNKRINKNNSLPSVHMYQMNDKNKKKLLENYYRYNYCFNNFCKIKNSSKKKNIIKNNNAFNKNNRNNQ